LKLELLVMMVWGITFLVVGLVIGYLAGFMSYECPPLPVLECPGCPDCVCEVVACPPRPDCMLELRKHIGQAEDYKVEMKRWLK